MSFVTEMQRRELAEHQLTCIIDVHTEVPVAAADYPKWRQLCCFRLGRPSTSIHAMYLLFTPVGIVLTGDTILSEHNGRGIVSDPGYNLGWFGSKKSEHYLCEKFFRRQEWEFKDCLAQLREWAGLGEDEPYFVDDPEKRIAFRKLVLEIEANGFGEWESADKIYDAMAQIDCHDLLDEGVPGYDYPRQEAGWLCAIQQRFATLCAEQGIVT